MKRKLLFAIVALLCSVGAQKLHAAAADYLTGWTEVTSLPADKAEWQYESALSLYCEATGKQPEELEESDTDIIWNNACNHCSMFLTWAIMRGFCGLTNLRQSKR